MVCGGCGSGVWWGSWRGDGGSGGSLTGIPITLMTSPLTVAITRRPAIWTMTTEANQPLHVLHCQVNMFVPWFVSRDA